MWAPAGQPQFADNVSIMSGSNYTGTLLPLVADMTVEYTSLHRALKNLTLASAGLVGDSGPVRASWDAAALLLDHLASIGHK